MASKAVRFDWIAFATVLATILSWGSAFAAIRAGLAAVPPVELAAARYGLGAVPAVLYLLLGRRAIPPLRDLWRLVIVGFLFVTAYATLLNIGELTVPAGPASFIINTAPIFVALLATIFLGERFGLWGWIGTFVCMTGIALIAWGEGDEFGLNRGALLILAAALCASVASIIQKPLLARMPPLTVTAWVLMFGALPFLFFVPSTVAAVTAAPFDIQLAVLYLALVPTVIGYLTWAIALRRLPASRAANFLYGVPPTATLIGFVWLGEFPKTLGVVGAGMAILGVVIVNTLRSKAPPDIKSEPALSPRFPSPERS